MSTETPIHIQTKTIDLFRKLSMGESFRMESNSYEAPHSYARSIGIRVSVKRMENGKTRKHVLEITRVPNTRKANKSGRKPGGRFVRT